MNPVNDLVMLIKILPAVQWNIKTAEAVDKTKTKQLARLQPYSVGLEESHHVVPNINPPSKKMKGLSLGFEILSHSIKKNSVFLYVITVFHTPRKFHVCTKPANCSLSN